MSLDRFEKYMGRRSLPENYVALGLQLDRVLNEVDEDFLLHYLGPRLPDAYDRLHMDAEECFHIAGELAETVEQMDDPVRREFLRDQLAAFQNNARLACGQGFGFFTRVRRLYGVKPESLDDEAAAEAAETLRTALKCGDDDLRARMRQWRKKHTIPRSRTAGYLDLCCRKAREMTDRLLPLPGNECVRFELSEGSPAKALMRTRWEGRGRSRRLTSTVAVDVGTPLLSFQIPFTVFHEAYPGHHTETAIKMEAYRRTGNVEATASFCQTP